MTGNFYRIVFAVWLHREITSIYGVCLSEKEAKELCHNDSKFSYSEEVAIYVNGKYLILKETIPQSVLGSDIQS